MGIGNRSMGTLLQFGESSEVGNYVASSMIMGNISKSGIGV